VRQRKQPTVFEKEDANGLDVDIYPTTFLEFLHELENSLIGRLPLLLDGMNKLVKGTNKLVRTWVSWNEP